MSLNLVRREVKGSPLSALDHDGNLDKIEEAIEDIESSITVGTTAGTLAAGDDARIVNAASIGVAAGISIALG
jgi:hypothetical protein